MTEHILVVEDEEGIRKLIQQWLTRSGFRVTALANGGEVKTSLAAGDVDLVVTDLGLPDIDGLALIRQIREYSNVGIIVVSARGETTERVIGLEVGADDYLPKPFDQHELAARVRSVLRRKSARPETTVDDDRLPFFTFNGWKLDCSSRALYDASGASVALTSAEYKLLEVLVARANRVLSRDQLLDLTSTNDAPAFDRSIDVRVGRLRRKLGDDSKDPQIIKTVRNGGYIFVGKVGRM